MWPQIKAWLVAATRAFHSARALLSFNRPEAAYMQYHLAFTIIDDLIPACRDFHCFECTAGHLHQEFKRLQEVI